MVKLKVFGLLILCGATFMFLFIPKVQSSPAIWNIETVDSGGMVGLYLSLALDSKDYPHISYYDVSNGDLKYAKWNDSAWSIEAVDTAGDVGGYCSLAVGYKDRPHISYYDYSNGDLKYARWTGSAWSIEAVDTAGDVGLYSSLALDSKDYPHISHNNVSNGDLKYAKWNGATWSVETVDTVGITGWFCSLALDSNQLPHIGYYDLSNGDLKYAKWNGSAWSIEAVDTAGDVGYTPSLALDSNDLPHIGYYDNTKGDLKYAKWNGSAWSIEAVDTAGDVGGYCSLALDSNDCPHISYWDISDYDLKYARWTGSTWSIEAVDTAGGVGLSSSLALDSNDLPHIGYYDATNFDLKYAQIAMRKLSISLVGSGSTYPALGVHLYENGTEVPVQATPSMGWIFDHWVLDGLVIETMNPIPVTMSRDRDLTAIFVGAPPLIESCNQVGMRVDSFNVTDKVYVNGTGYIPSANYSVYVVEDVEWTDGMIIPARVPGTIATVLSDSSGNIPPTVVWNSSLLEGKYDVCVDVDGNGRYDHGIDALDDNDIQVTAGFVIPEFPSFLVLPSLMVITLLAAIILRRKSHRKCGSSGDISTYYWLQTRPPHGVLVSSAYV